MLYVQTDSTILAARIFETQEARHLVVPNTLVPQYADAMPRMSDVHSVIVHRHLLLRRPLILLPHKETVATMLTGIDPDHRHIAFSNPLERYWSDATVLLPELQVFR